LRGQHFECFVAALLWTLGYDVTLTQRSHDGGKDIVAISRRDNHQHVFVECKTHRPSKRVGVTAVRQLLGAVIQAERVPKGLLVTAGHFTPAARALAELNRWRIELRSLDDIKLWMAWYLNEEPWRATRTGIPSPEDEYTTIQLGSFYIKFREHETRYAMEYLRSIGANLSATPGDQLRSVP